LQNIPTKNKKQPDKYKELMNILKKHVTKDLILRIAAECIFLKHAISGVYQTKMQNKIFANKFNNVLTKYIFFSFDNRIFLHPYI
jgi:hypothetical protein